MRMPTTAAPAYVIKGKNLNAALADYNKTIKLGSPGIPLPTTGGQWCARIKGTHAG